jgi:hypothetical protein
VDESVYSALQQNIIFSTKTTTKPFSPNQVGVDNNNNQVFYSQASWGRLEIKPHEQKNQGQNKSEKEGGKQRAIKNQIKKGENAIKR